MYLATNSTQSRKPLHSRKNPLHRLWVWLLCAAFAVIPAAGLAESEAKADDIHTLDESISAQLSIMGEKSSGITYTVHDVYFDGYLLMLTITQTPNDAGYSVYSSVLEQFDITDENIADGTLPLGSYCEPSLFDKEGNPIDSPMVGSGSSVGSSCTLTVCCRFLPYEQLDEINIRITCGVMESPGIVTGALETFELTVPIQTNANVRTITLTDSEGQPPYLDEITVAETEDVAGIFAFYTHNVSGDCICPAAFIFADDVLLDASEYTSNAGDTLNHRGFTYCAIRKTKPLQTVHVRDLHSWEEYDVNLENGAVNLRNNFKN